MTNTAPSKQRRFEVALRGARLVGHKTQSEMKLGKPRGKKPASPERKKRKHMVEDSHDCHRFPSGSTIRRRNSRSHHLYNCGQIFLSWIEMDFAFGDERGFYRRAARCGPHNDFNGFLSPDRRA